MDEIGRVDLDTIDRQTQPKRTTFPKGIIAIVIISLAGLAIGFADKTQNSLIYTIILGLDLLLAVGLVLRKEAVRKVAMGFAIVTVTASAALVLGYRGLIDSTVNAEAMFIEEAKKLQNQSPTKQLTHEQQQHLDAMQFQLEAQKFAIGKNSAMIYGKYGATIAAFTVIAIYLALPKVKAAFNEQEEERK